MSRVFKAWSRFLLGVVVVLGMIVVAVLIGFVVIPATAVLYPVLVWVLEEGP